MRVILPRGHPAPARLVNIAPVILRAIGVLRVDGRTIVAFLLASHFVFVFLFS